ncbi:MAG: DUF72 domain-containing protein [Euryarchaeota archaeon]|nr:DUF72 domain-containing protein [Euryarchaeota archaeon]
MRMYVGCCGFAVNMKEYFKTFNVVEIQSTFYKLPRLETAQKWREQAPTDFKFCVKSWQGITHPGTSPTWKKVGIKLEPEDIDKYGFLRPTKQVSDAWKKTTEICEILRADICLIQCPASFKQTEENIKNAEKFFSKIKRNKIKIAWEPRGWEKTVVKNICKKFNLIHCVDIFASDATWFSNSKIAYFRLHGKYEKGRINYNHEYSSKELQELLTKIHNLKAIEIYLLFNNLYMYKNAKEFMRLVEK